jgi:hypothetical protein
VRFPTEPSTTGRENRRQRAFAAEELDLLAGGLVVMPQSLRLFAKRVDLLDRIDQENGGSEPPAESIRKAAPARPSNPAHDHHRS